MAERRRTSTSDFGAGRRESHDASGFYGRFDPPVLDDDETVAEPRVISDPFVHGDARDLSMLDDRSVALVVTSPPYFAGKQYENELERDGIPASSACECSNLVVGSRSISQTLAGGHSGA